MNCTIASKSQAMVTATTRAQIFYGIGDLHD
jgi:hypothetical protein